MIDSHEDMALSFTRCAQVWDTMTQEWQDMAPDTIIGPPHRLFGIPWQMSLLIGMVIRIGLPLSLMAEGFWQRGRKAKEGTELKARFNHIWTACANPTAATEQKVRQTFYQSDVIDESRHSTKLRAETTVPIMQIQGQDEFAWHIKSLNRLVSDQPYFGKYNLYPNEVEDLYPDCVGQEEEKKVKGLLTRVGYEDGDHGSYLLLKLKKDARFSRFVLVPDACHFNIVENPHGCAAAIIDFIHAVNDGGAVAGPHVVKYGRRTVCGERIYSMYGKEDWNQGRVSSRKKEN
eukprot:g872.t1